MDKLTGIQFGWAWVHFLVQKGVVDAQGNTVDACADKNLAFDMAEKAAIQMIAIGGINGVGLGAAGLLQ